MSRLAARVRRLLVRKVMLPLIERRILVGQREETARFRNIVRWLSPQMQWATFAESLIQSSQTGDARLRRMVLDVAGSLPLHPPKAPVVTGSNEVVVTTVALFRHGRLVEPRTVRNENQTSRVKVVSKYFALPTILNRSRSQARLHRFPGRNNFLRTWLLTVKNLVVIWRQAVCYQIRYEYGANIPTVVLGRQLMSISLDPSLSFWERDLLPNVRQDSATKDGSADLQVIAVIANKIPGLEKRPRDWLEAGIRSHPGVVMEFVGESPIATWVQKLQHMCHHGPYGIFFDALNAESRKLPAPNAELFRIRIPFGEPGVETHRELTSHAQFPQLQHVVISNVSVQHGRFLVQGDEVLLLDDASDLRSSFVAGLWQYALSAPTLNGQALIARSRNSTDPIHEGICAFGRADTNWFHWMMETLPRALYIDSLVDEAVPFLVRDDLPPSMRQTLETLSRRAIRAIPTDATASVYRLHGALMTSPVLDSVWPDRLTYQPNPLAVSIVQRAVSSALGREDADTEEKIFHLRTTSSRRILNAGQVTGLLESNGFVQRNFANEGFRQQVRSLQKASVFVSQGGAALVNAMFLPPRTPVVVMTSTHQRQDLFWSHVLDTYGMRPFIAKEKVQSKGGTRLNAHHDFSVDIPLLTRLLSDVF